MIVLNFYHNYWTYSLLSLYIQAVVVCMSFAQEMLYTEKKRSLASI